MSKSAFNNATQLRAPAGDSKTGVATGTQGVASSSNGFLGSEKEDDKVRLRAEFFTAMRRFAKEWGVARAGNDPATHGFSIRDSESQIASLPLGNTQESTGQQNERMRHRMHLAQNPPDLVLAEFLELWPTLSKSKQLELLHQVRSAGRSKVAN